MMTSQTGRGAAGTLQTQCCRRRSALTEEQARARSLSCQRERRLLLRTALANWAEQRSRQADQRRARASAAASSWACQPQTDPDLELELQMQVDGDAPEGCQPQPAAAVQALVICLSSDSDSDSSDDEDGARPAATASSNCAPADQRLGAPLRS